MFGSVDGLLLPLVARLQALLSSSRGQTLAEYSLIVTIVAVGVTVAALIFFRTEIAGAFNSAATCLTGGCS